MDESKRLVLHFDVDEILLESAEDCVNVALANSAVVRKKSPLGTGASASTRRAPSFDDYVWHDGTPLDLSQRAPVEAEGKAKNKQFQLVPPRLVRTVNAVSGKQGQEPASLRFIGLCPTDCVPFHEVFPQFSRHFTTVGPGKIYRPAAMDLLELLRWPSHWDAVPDLAVAEDSGAYQRLIPSFLQLLVRLMDQGRSHSIVFHSNSQRKLDIMASALDAFALGRHPLFDKSFSYSNPIHLRCRDNVHWRVEVKNCSADTTSADFEREDCSKEADAQAHARTTHRDDTAAGSVGASEHADAVEWDIVLRSRSKCCEDILSEHAVAKMIARCDTAIGLQGGLPASSHHQQAKIDETPGTSNSKAGAGVGLVLEFQATVRRSAGVHVGVRDDVDGEMAAPSCRPMWFTAEDNAMHPIAFGRHADAAPVSASDPHTDSPSQPQPWLIRWRHRKTDEFQTVESRSSQRLLLDILLVENDFIQAACDPDYFVIAVQQCEANLGSIGGRDRLVALLSAAQARSISGALVTTLAPALSGM